MRPALGRRAAGKRRVKKKDAAATARIRHGRRQQQLGLGPGRGRRRLRLRLLGNGAQHPHRNGSHADGGRRRRNNDLFGGSLRRWGRPPPPAAPSPPAATGPAFDQSQQGCRPKGRQPRKVDQRGGKEEKKPSRSLSNRFLPPLPHPTPHFLEHNFMGF